MIVFGWLIGVFIVGYWASKKGRSSGGWGLLALFISPLLAGIALAIVGSNQENMERAALDSGAMKKCHACAELVRSEAMKCRFCGELFR